MNKFAKKMIGIVTASVVTLSFAVSSFAADWETHWAADYISSARNSGWADMREKDNFEPSAYASREEVIYMLYASQLNFKTVLDMELSDDLSGFTDANTINSKYLIAFRVLAGNRLVTGYADKTLKPKAYVTRAEMAKLVSYLIPSTVLSKNFTPYTDDIPEWASIDIERCSRAGIISGYPDNTFRASNYITRGEVVRMIQSLREFISSVETTTQTTTRKTTTQTTTQKEETTETTTEETTETTTSDGDTYGNNMTLVNSLFNIINAKRFDVGTNSLILDETLCQLAFLKAKDMYETNYNQVYTTSYGSIDEVLSAAEIKYTQCDMFITSSIFTAEDAVSSFEANSETKELMLRQGFTRMGAGIYEDRWAVIYMTATGD